jgi:ParB-like chromosome segregation protein Spo0J
MAVPCWVRKMSDEDAYMALVTSNSQSELTPLERGLHALNSGKAVEAYAKGAGREKQIQSVRREVWAAKVASSSNHVVGSLSEQTRHLAEIHAAPEWLWPALVERLVAEGWTVETTRKHVERLKAMSRLNQDRDQ